MLERCLQSAKALSPISVSVVGRDTLTMLLQFENTSLPIAVIPSGITTVSSAMQSLKQPSERVLKPFENTISSRLSQLANANSPRDVNASGILISSMLSQFSKALFPISLRVVGSLTVERFSQFANADASMRVTPSGSTMLSSTLLSLKIPLGIVVTPLRIVTLAVSLSYSTTCFEPSLSSMYFTPPSVINLLKFHNTLQGEFTPFQFLCHPDGFSAALA